MASTVEAQAKAPPHLRDVVDFLRSSKAGMKVRVGVLNGKRVDYFKGEIIEQLLPLSFGLG
jgi:translocation protein SEC62